MVLQGLKGNARMLSENDRQNLFRNLSRNRVVLVTGAGFSKDARNIQGEKLPDSKSLASKLWEYLYGDEYDDLSNLKTLYAAAQKNRKGISGLKQFLSENLHAETIPSWYKEVTNWYWNRIYTFNIDDLIEQIYHDLPVSLKTIVAPDYFHERDQFLRQIQYIKLHGSITEDKPLTFGPMEYATRAAMRTDIWYHHFVEDYSTLPTIFIGTELDEPLFWQYIELRGAHARGEEKVRRPKCFLVNPMIPKPNIEMLEQFNIVPIFATAQQFFEWLSEQCRPYSREDVLRNVYEGLEPALQASQQGMPTERVREIEYFFSRFKAPVRPVEPKRSSMFLLGIPPTWDDIASDIDARRDISGEINSFLREMHDSSRYDILQITSPAGGGKSTVLRRAALELVDDGFTVYFSDGSSPLDSGKVARYVSSFPNRSFLFFDNAGDDLSVIAELWDRVKGSPNCPVFVLASRTNDAVYKGDELERVGAQVKEIPLTNLSLEEIRRVLETLDRHDRLGKLKEKSQAAREKEFVRKAKKQILVAMREATSGLGFDEILTDEFHKISPGSAKLLYLINALASDDDYGMTMQQMISSIDLPPNEVQLLVERNLSGILVQHENDPSKFYIRHPAIAHYIVQSAPRPELAVATRLLLCSLATVMPEGAEKKNSRAFRLYRRLLSHTEMLARYPNDLNTVRSIYDGIRDSYRDDGHYWLHYGAYEVEQQGGEIGLAENYLDQASGLMPYSRQVETVKAHLLFKKAEQAANPAVAEQYANEALAILRVHMANPQSVSKHALHIFGHQMDAYIKKWIPRSQQAKYFSDIHRELKRSIPPHMENHPIIVNILKTLKRSELETAIKNKPLN